MSVLMHGFPNLERLRCDHPVCDELATNLIHTKDKDEREGERFACTTHCAQMQIGQPNVKVEKLKVAGERNRPKGTSEAK